METKQATSDKTSDKSKRLIYADDARRAIEHADPAFDYCIDNVPTVDAVEVVLCKDCTNYQETFGKDSGKPCGYGSCGNPCAMIGIVYDEDFCSYGERRPDGQ